MAFDYAAMEETAQELIAEFGFPAVIRRITSTGDKWDPEQTPQDYDCTAVVVGFTAAEKATGLIKETDRKALVSTEGLAVTPTLADKFVRNGAVLEIVSVKPVLEDPGDANLMWILQVRS